MAAKRSEDARTGWRSRRAKQRDRRRKESPAEREAANRARAALIASLHQETVFNPSVAPAGDHITAMSDEDLAAHYKSLTGRPPSPKAKRATIEAAVRKAEQARAETAQDEAEDDTAEDDV